MKKEISLCLAQKACRFDPTYWPLGLLKARQYHCQSSAPLSTSWSKTMSDIRSDRKSTRLNSSHLVISYAVFCLKKKNSQRHHPHSRHGQDRGRNGARGRTRQGPSGHT